MPTTDLPESESESTNESSSTSTAVAYPVLPIPDGVIFPEMVVTISLQSPEARQLLDGGRVISYPRDVRVFTSTRMTGRVPWGMATQLAAWERDHAAGRWPQVPGVRGLEAKYRRKAALREAWRDGSRDEPFERVWFRHWTDPAVRAAFDAAYPLRSLPDVLEGVSGPRTGKSVRVKTSSR